MERPGNGGRDCLSIARRPRSDLDDAVDRNGLIARQAEVHRRARRIARSRRLGLDLHELRHDLATEPFLAPDAARLLDLGLDPRAVAAAERAGLLLRISEQIVLAPGADAEAARLLAGLPVPFTVAQARQVLRTTRRVAIPLLQYLDRTGVTESPSDQGWKTDEFSIAGRTPFRGLREEVVTDFRRMAELGVGHLVFEFPVSRGEESMELFETLAGIREEAGV